MIIVASRELFCMDIPTAGGDSVAAGSEERQEFQPGLHLVAR